MRRFIIIVPSAHGIQKQHDAQPYEVNPGQVEAFSGDKKIKGKILNIVIGGCQGMAPGKIHHGADQVGQEKVGDIIKQGYAAKHLNDPGKLIPYVFQQGEQQQRWSYGHA